jgi:hypothetical protein
VDGGFGVPLAPSSLIFLLILCLSILLIRRTHARHVHILWYLFFLSFCLFSGSLLYLYNNAVRDAGFVSVKQLTSLLHLFGDVEGELYFVTAIIIVGIVPQLLSFIISGLFGCGSPPVLVSTITKLAIISLIKFLCILSGGMTGGAILFYYIVYPHDESLISDLYQALIMITGSFSLSAIYYTSGTLYQHITGRLHLRYLNIILMYMTRYSTN